MSNATDAQAAVQRSEDGQYVQFGVVDSGVFVGFSQMRSGDYDEMVAAGAQTQAPAEASSTPSA